MVKTNIAPPAGGFGAQPAPPHVHVPPPPNSAGPGALIAVALVALLVIGGATAGLLLFRASAAPAPPPVPTIVTEGTTTTIGSPPPTAEPAAADSANQELGMIGMIGFLDARCNANDAQSCVAAGTMYQQGAGGLPSDKAKAKAYFAKACAMGDSSGCTMQKQVK